MCSLRLHQLRTAAVIFILEGLLHLNCCWCSAVSLGEAGSLSNLGVGLVFDPSSSLVALAIAFSPSVARRGVPVSYAEAPLCRRFGVKPSK